MALNYPNPALGARSAVSAKSKESVKEATSAAMLFDVRGSRPRFTPHRRAPCALLWNESGTEVARFRRQPACQRCYLPPFVDDVMNFVNSSAIARPTHALLNPR